MSDTPRTDKETFFPHDSKYRVCDADFCRQLERELNAANQRIKHLLDGIAKQNQTIEQACGKVLGYPWFKDDQKNFPGATEKDGVCVGEHVAETIVSELAKRHTEVLARIKRLEEFVDQLTNPKFTRDDLPKEALLQRIKRLEEAGDRMDKTAEPFVLASIDEDSDDGPIPMSDVDEQYEITYDSPPTAGDHVAMNRARKEWRKAKEAKP